MLIRCDDPEIHRLMPGEERAQPLAAAPGPRRIAVLESAGPDRDFVADSLSSLHTVCAFDHLEGLVAALQSRAAFALLLVAFEGNQDTFLVGAKFLRRLVGESMPVLLLIRPGQIDRAAGFLTGDATDFVVMPCEGRELVARVANALRMASESSGTPVGRMSFGRYTFEPRGCVIDVDGRRVRVKPREFDLALFLFRQAGHTQSREQIFRTVWGQEPPLVRSRTVDVHIMRLRRLLGLGPLGVDAKISSVRGMGYRLVLGASS